MMWGVLVRPAEVLTAATFKTLITANANLGALSALHVISANTMCATFTKTDIQTCTGACFKKNRNLQKKGLWQFVDND